MCWPVAHSGSSRNWLTWSVNHIGHRDMSTCRRSDKEIHTRVSFHITVEVRHRYWRWNRRDCVSLTARPPRPLITFESKSWLITHDFNDTWMNNSLLLFWLGHARWFDSRWWWIPVDRIPVCFFSFLLYIGHCCFWL